jgi:hypothetical protein
MATARNTWKRREREAAAIFGARRNVLSGSSGRDDRDTSDSSHPRLHVETKLRETHSALALWRKCLLLARKLKTPVLMLAEKHQVGFLVCVHSDDLPEVVREWLAAQTDEELCVIERDVRVLRGLDE